LIPPDTIRAILASSPIEEVVREYLPLQPDGRNLKALCPFHSEKTPSFKVNVSKQFFHCFGCGEHGNAIDFVMKVDRVDFPDAVRTLARRAGIAIPEASREDARNRERREVLYRANEIAAAYFQAKLAEGMGAEARRYLGGRGLTPETIRRFRIGFAPPGWDGLLGRLREARIPPQVGEAAGLVSRRRSGDGFYDTFRNRIAFSIVDAKERIVGFGARTLGDEAPKYLNTPETALFQKGRILYALPFARERVQRERHIVIMEGYMDVIMAFQCGFSQAVACLGTALTEGNARELRRYADRVTLVFDADPAGLRAAEKSVGSVIGQGLEARVLVLPEGKDPCDFLLARGGEAFARQVDGAREGFGFVLDRALEQAEGEGPARIRRAVSRVLETIGRLADPITRSVLVQRAAERFGLPEADLRAELRPSRMREGAPASADPASPRPAAEDVLLELGLGDADLLERVVSAWPSERYADPELGRIARAAAALMREGRYSQRELLSRLGAEGDAKRAIQIVERAEDRRTRTTAAMREEALGRAIAELDRRDLRKVAEEVRSRWREALARGDQGASARYLTEYTQIQRSLKGRARSRPNT
ncbi:MAG: DNA primase, partial [Planctomycetes bacterium]|nr:DNA primase [Planctomycetota bacterium]